MDRFSKMTVAATIGAAFLTAMPMAAIAKDKGNGNGNGNGHGARGKVVQHVNVRQHTHNAPVYGVHCPPGLAKKSPACVPPGQAKKGLVVGDHVNLDLVHIITRPGLYGLGEPSAGRYAIVDGRLLRIDSQTGQILSFIRLVDAILD